MTHLWPHTLALLLPQWLLQRHDRQWHRLGILSHLQELCDGKATLPSSSLLLAVLKAWREGRPEALEHFLASPAPRELGLSATLEEDLRRGLSWLREEPRALCRALLGAEDGGPRVMALCRVWRAALEASPSQAASHLEALEESGAGDWHRLGQRLLQEMERGSHGTMACGAAEKRRGGAPEEESLRRRELCQLSCHRYGRMVGASPAFLEMERRLRLAARDPLPLLLTGETGTGKELAVEYLHRLAFPQGAPLVAVNCGGLGENVAEAELFGSVRGAFTGAVEREGLVAQSDGGTLFLDEFASLPPTVQARLLRFLESGVYRRMGETRERQVRCRVVAATCEVQRLRQDLRQDLLHRVAGRVLHVPSLSRRGEDIPLLVKAFLLDYGEWNPASHPLLAPVTLRRLQGAAWPGNIRQLRHAVLRLASLRGEELEEELLLVLQEGAVPRESSPGDEEKTLLDGGTLREALARFEQRCIQQALRTQRQDRRKAALQLGISLPKLYSRLREAEGNARA